MRPSVGRLQQQRGKPTHVGGPAPARGAERLVRQRPPAAAPTTSRSRWMRNAEAMVGSTPVRSIMPSHAARRAWACATRPLPTDTPASSRA